MYGLQYERVLKSGGVICSHQMAFFCVWTGVFEMHFQAVVVKSPRAGREGGAWGELTLSLKWKRITRTMEPGRWDVAIRRGAVETGGEAERGGRRESRRNAPAPRVERAPWVFVKAREHLPPVWQLISPPPYFSYRSFLLCKPSLPFFFYFLCPLSFSRLVAGHKHSACAFNETFINACLTFWGLRTKKS